MKSLTSKLQEVIMDFIRQRDGNLVAAGVSIKLDIFKHKVPIESIWYSNDEEKFCVHCGCKEFEGDLDIDSLSDANQQHILHVLVLELK